LLEMSSPIEVVSPDKWFAEGMLPGDVLLCDPFTGRPLIEGGLGKPPEAFAEDNDLGGGYGIWRGANFMAPPIPPKYLRPGQTSYPPIEVGVLLTEPSAPNGAGILADLRENIGAFSAIAIANKRSLVREAQIKGVVPTLGSVTASGEVVPDDAYLEAIMNEAADQNKLVFSIDPEKDFFNGQPVGRTATGLYKVETAIRAEMALQDNPEDTQAHIGAMDAVYCDRLQWHGVGVAGNEGGNLMADPQVGFFPDSLLVIAAAEHHHYVKKFQYAGGAAVHATAIFARPEFENIPEARAYPIYSEGGFIPGGAVS
jgi:hypothetical protein